MLDLWLDEHEVMDGSPYLIDPFGRPDVRIGDYFRTELFDAPPGTQEAAAYDLKRWVKFLWENRSEKSWRDATPADRRGYKQWRTVDPRGPQVELVTWDREVSTVNQFYIWAIANDHVRVNPIQQRESRSREPRRGHREETPAEASHAGSRNDIKWMPAADYREWRDVGLRGFSAAGLEDPSFRGGFASRNATYSDTMIRTGLRLSEQTSLSIFEVPDLLPGLRVQRFWLPGSIAKNESARHVYLAVSVLRDIWDFIEAERAEAIEHARAVGTYERMNDPLIVSDRTRPFVVVDGERVPMARLDEHERLRVLIDTPEGLEPAALWLNEDGLPSRPSAWQEVFKTANKRCGRLGVRHRCHPHMLRHSFAVITLEQAVPRAHPGAGRDEPPPARDLPACLWGPDELGPDATRPCLCGHDAEVPAHLEGTGDADPDAAGPRHLGAGRRPPRGPRRGRGGPRPCSLT